MEQQKRESIYLSEKEFLLLCSFAGMRRVTGLFQNRQISMTQEDAVYALHSLIRKDLIDDSEMKVKEPVASFFSIIGQSKKVWLICRRKIEGAAACCYLGERILVSELSSTEENTMRLFDLKEDGFADWLSQAGCLPETSAPDLTEEALREERLREILGIKSLTENKDLTGEDVPDEVQSVLMQLDLESGQTDWRLFWDQEPAQDYLVIQSGNRSDVLPYGEEAAQQLLQKLRREEVQL